MNDAQRAVKQKVTKSAGNARFFLLEYTLLQGIITNYFQKNKIYAFSINLSGSTEQPEALMPFKIPRFANFTLYAYLAK
ncbi:MAG: hypothetical protein FDX18_06755 [Chlorobium sp.]|nr:MAG: hypothetical protein FDX18_06755 [Chlorobium sp.]